MPGKNSGLKPKLFENLENALEARGYFDDEYSKCKSGVACISFTGGRYEFDVLVTIEDDDLRMRYYDAAKKAYGSNKEYYVSIQDDEIMISHIWLK